MNYDYRIIGFSPGAAPQGEISVVIETPTFYAYAKVSPAGLITLDQGSYFSKFSFYGPNPRHFIEIMMKWDPDLWRMRRFLPVWNYLLTRKAARRLSLWNQEALDAIGQAQAQAG